MKPTIASATFTTFASLLSISQVNKYQSFATMEPYLTNPGKKNGLAIK
jgi:hypothetical protein